MTILRSTFTIKRLTPGAYVNGFWVEGSSSTFNILATVQPVSGLEMQSLPEGRRESQAVKIYTSTQLRTIEDSKNPDILLAFGYEFEIATVEPWQSNLINHYKCIAYKLRGDA